MAPLTRGSATRDHVPTRLMAEYYAQRASAGLIISEATGTTVAGSRPHADGPHFCPVVAYGPTGPLSLHGVEPVSAAPYRLV